MDPRWRLKELVEASRKVLARHGEPEGDSKRVRWVPNARLVRYYTTLGLLDRPAEMRGRTALYSLRHLLQLLAIKTEQARGLRLEDIQGRLAGLPNRRLAAIAGLPEHWKECLHEPEPELEASPPTAGTEAPASPAAPGDDADRFWERAPRLPSPAATDAAGRGRAPAGPAEAPALAGLKLAEGAWLMLDTPDLDPADRRRLAAAAAPLIEVLNQIRRPEEETRG